MFAMVCRVYGGGISCCYHIVKANVIVGTVCRDMHTSFMGYVVETKGWSMILF